MQKEYQLAVDIEKKILTPSFEVNTLDLKTIKLKITITKGMTLVDLTDIAVRMSIRKPDGNVIFQDCQVTNAKGGQVEIILENQAYIMPGSYSAEIMCFKGTDKVAVTGSFSYRSIRGIMDDKAVKSKSEFTAITGMIKDTQETIEDLRKNGTGVDAQARQEVQEVNTQLVDIDNNVVKTMNYLNDLGINLKENGAVGDANYFNESDKQYYSDSSFTKLATDNKAVFASILAYTNRQKGNYKFYFPEGNYYSSSPFEIAAAGVHIEGNHAKLITSVATSGSEIYCVYIKECKRFRCHGMEFENIIRDKSVSNAYQGRYYHIWLRGDGTNKIEYCNIYDNVFIDKVSIPNSTLKPFNGAIYLSHAKNISIHDNKFHNSCGRVIYLSSCENGDIYGNKMENVGFISPEITNVNVGTLCVRVLSCKNIKIHDNTVIGTSVNNPKQISVSGATLATSDGGSTPNKEIQVYGNTYIANETKFIAFNLYGSVSTAIFDNDITLNPNSSFVTILPSIASEAERVDVVLENNRINKAHSGVLGLGFPSSQAGLVHLALKGNTFNSEDAPLTRLTENRNNIINNNSLSLENNSIYQNNSFRYKMKSATEVDYNSMATETLAMSSGNYATYLSPEGVLNIPDNVKMIEIDTTGASNVLITDIKFNNAYQSPRELTFIHKSGNGSVVLKNNSNFMRLPSASDITLSIFSSVKLIYSINRWYKIS